MKPLLAHWNLDFSPAVERRMNIRARMRHNLLSRPKGRGNRWARRALTLERAFRASGGFYLRDLIP